MTYSPNFRGSVGKASSRQTKTSYQNGTVSTMPIAAAVVVNTSGQVLLCDVSAENASDTFVGLVADRLPSGAYGEIVSDGRMENIPSALGFAIGDAIYVGLTPGSLTNVKPDLSVLGWASGYFVIFVGVVVANEFTPGNQDIQIFKQIVGQL